MKFEKLETGKTSEVESKYVDYWKKINLRKVYRK